MDKNLQEFLNYHKIDLDELYDAKGQPVNHIKDEMKREDKLFAFNTTPCQKAGHTIRDRYSHCIVCETANIAFMKRTRLPGFVYIAGSLSKQFIKVGMSTTKLEDRLSRLNSRKVGNTNDWVMIKAIKCDYANEKEIAVQKLLRKYKMKTIIIGQIHDSIIADVYKGELKDYLHMSKKVMTEDIRKHWKWINVPLEIEAEVCDIDQSWNEKKKYKEVI